MKDRTALADLIGRARHRLSLFLAVHSLAAAAVALLAGVILFLVAGSNTVGVSLFFVSVVAAIVCAIWQARQGIGSGYRIAQNIDAKLSLDDSLSTALYFKDQESEAVRFQRSEAESAARSADLRAAFPFTAPRSLYAAAALAFVAASLFGLRYGITRRLDLKTPLLRLAVDNGVIPDVSKPGKPQPSLARNSLKPSAIVSGLPPAPWQSDPTADPKAADNLLDAAADPDGATTGAAKQSGTTSQAGETKNQTPGGQSDGSSKEASTSSDEQGNAAENGKGDSPQSASQSPSKTAGSQNQQNSPGMMDRMRDAVSDLLSKLKPNDSKQSSPSQSKSNNAQAGAQQQASGSSQTANGAQQAAQDANAQGDAGAQSGQKADSASRAKAGDSVSARNDAPGSKSGAGSQDGSKDSRYAEQLAAMGKISELIGKRAANVTGEVVVEVASGTQQLKTQYSSRGASHSASGGEIDRDEVPLAYQQYVKQYFEEIRKSPPRPGPSGARQ